MTKTTKPATVKVAPKTPETVTETPKAIDKKALSDWQAEAVNTAEKAKRTATVSANGNVVIK